jgi:hypothetical protein
MGRVVQLCCEEQPDVWWWPTHVWWLLDVKLALLDLTATLIYDMLRHHLTPGSAAAAADR